jgi:hypothetical protein
MPFTKFERPKLIEQSLLSFAHAVLIGFDATVPTALQRVQKSWVPHVLAHTDPRASITIVALHVESDKRRFAVLRYAIMCCSVMCCDVMC